MPSPHKQVTAVVADAGTTSGVVDFTDLIPCGVYIPAEVEGTTLAFTVALTSDGTFLPLWSAADGAAVSYTIDATGCYVAFDPALFAGVKFAKAVLAAQTGAVTLTFLCRPA